MMSLSVQYAGFRRFAPVLVAALGLLASTVAAQATDTQEPVYWGYPGWYGPAPYPHAFWGRPGYRHYWWRGGRWWCARHPYRCR